jgi:Calx-beta domain
LIVPAGSASRNVPVPLINDSLVEGPESLVLALAPSPDYTIESSANEVRWMIQDNQSSAGLPLVRAESLQRVAREDGTANALVRITRQGPLSSPLSVPYEVRGRAQPGIDHDRLSGQASFGVGVASVQVSLSALDDALAEPDEYWLLELLPGTNYWLDGTFVAAGEVEDDDRLAGLPLVAVQTERASALEAGGSLVFDLTRTGAVNAPLKVDLNWSGSALGGLDFTGAPVSASFAAGNAFARISLTGLDDALAEGTEALSVEVAPSAAYGLTALSKRNALLLDNDTNPLPPGSLVQILSPLTLGREFAADLATQPASACLVAVSPSRAYLPLGDLPIFIDLATTQLLGTPQSTPDGSAQLRLQVLSNPQWIGVELHFQSFAIDSKGVLHGSQLTSRLLRAAP